MKSNFFPILIIIASVCMVLSGCNEPRFNSDWRDCQIVIDGKYSDWKNTGAYYDEKRNVNISFFNDNEYFYICLITRSRDLETKVMESGFVAWFSSEGGKNRIFGVRFPTGSRSLGREEQRDESRDWRDQEDKSGLVDREQERWRDKDFNKRLEVLEGVQDKLEILKGEFDLKDKGQPPRPPHGESNKEHIIKRRDGPEGDFLGKGPNELSLEEARKLGIEAKVGRENDYFVYELKVPLVKSIEHPYAIGAKAGKPIGLELKISMFGMDMQGRGGGRRMPPGMSHGRRSQKSFRLQAIVILSSTPSI